MYFVILATDRPNTARLRQENRPAHLEYIRGFGRQIVVGGATLAPDGASMTGSFLLVDMPDRTAVDRFMRDDPYVRAGLFETVEIRLWHKVIFNAPEP